MFPIPSWRASPLVLVVTVCALLGCGGRNEAPAPGQNEAALLQEAKERSQKNLHQIGLAIHSYHDATRMLPVGVLDPRTGKLGLSWRVQILPYLGDDAAAKLHRRFKLDEPWDSAHNKALLAAMPRIYAPVRGTPPAGHTYYQGFADHLVGPKGRELNEQEAAQMRIPPVAVFPDPRQSHGPQEQFHPDLGALLRVRQFTAIQDGTSNTFLIAEAGEPVPWTKPQDIPCRVELDGPQGTVGKLGGMFDGDFHVLFADGSVHEVSRGVPAEKLWPFVTASGGEAVDQDILRPRTGQVWPGK